jgi:DNA-binding NarL/FixJ family response regulator
VKQIVITNRAPDPIRIGLISDEPIRLAGLSSIFDQPARQGRAQLIPVIASLEELLCGSGFEYLVIDLSSSSSGLGTLEAIRRARPGIPQIVIGPQGNDDLVIDSIIAGARAYLDLTASPEIVRRAIDEVTSGSIWAPRRLLSKLIDRLLKIPDSNITLVSPHLTDRERQVLDLILLARSNREIARQLGIEERTVKAHVGRLMRKTGADNRVELSLRAIGASIAPASGLNDRSQGNGSKNNDRSRNPKP